MADFKNLRVWQKSHALALEVHRVAGHIRGATNISLRSQMVRAAMSIPANIVEGRAHQSEREFGRFLKIALASGSELEHHLITARALETISETDFLTLRSQLVDVQKMLHAFLNRLDMGSSQAAPQKNPLKPEGTLDRFGSNPGPSGAP